MRASRILFYQSLKSDVQVYRQVAIEGCCHGELNAVRAALLGRQADLSYHLALDL